MKKGKLGICVLSAVALLGTVSVLTSCNDDGNKGSTTYTRNVGKPDTSLEMDSDYVVEYSSPKYFAGYLVRTGGESPDYISQKSESTVEGGSSAHLYAYSVPEGYSLGVSVTDGEGNPSSQISVSKDGTVSFPKVSEAKDYYIYLFATSDDDGVKTKMHVTVVPEGTIAKSAYYNYSSLAGTEREKMTGTSEKYLYNNGNAPIRSLINSGYQLYSSRLHSFLLDNENYIPGYGYGLLSYGTIDSPMDEEHTDAYKWFLHDQMSDASDLGNFNYLNSSEAAVSDLYSYVSASYWSSNVNAAGDSYGYEANLSRFDSPEAVNPDANGASDTWKIYVRVGGDSDGANGVTKGLSYRTSTKDATLSKYDKRAIKLEDYLTPFKLMATQSVGWYRGAEQAAESTKNRQIKGYAEYYAASKDYTQLDSDEEFMKKVGVKLDHSDNSITITFNDKITPDYAEYQVDGLWGNPICEDFVKDLGDGDVISGAKVYGTNKGSLTPLDTMLCVGPYYTMTYEAKKTIAFARNEDWPEVLCKDNAGRSMYNIKGVHLNVNSALGTNANEYIEKFEAGLTDYSNIPTDYWDKYASSPLRKKVSGSSFLNPLYINTYDKATYDEWFDADYVATVRTDGYEVKPALSNNNFYKGLMTGMDRNALAEYAHAETTTTITLPVTKASPKTALYNTSESHKKAVNDVFGTELDDLTNWKSVGANYFEQAIQEELDAGHYEIGTEDNPTVISFDITTVDRASTNYYFSTYTESWKESFDLAVQTHTNSNGKNDWVGANGKSLITLSVDKRDVPYDDNLANSIIYDGVQVGATDGQNVYQITGNALDVFNGLDIYKSDNSSGFSLNFGSDTSKVSADIKYSNKYWSYDALWAAGNGGALLNENSEIVEPISFDKSEASFEANAANKSYTVKLPLTVQEKYVSNISVQVDAIDAEGNEAYVEEPTAKYENGVLTMTFSGDAVIDGALLGDDYANFHYLDFEIHYGFVYEGTSEEKTVSGYWLHAKEF